MDYLFCVCLCCVHFSEMCSPWRDGKRTPRNVKNTKMFGSHRLYNAFNHFRINFDAIETQMHFSTKGPVVVYTNCRVSGSVHIHQEMVYTNNSRFCSKLKPGGGKKKKSYQNRGLPGGQHLSGPCGSILRYTRAYQRPYKAKSEKLIIRLVSYEFPFFSKPKPGGGVYIVVVPKLASSFVEGCTRPHFYHNETAQLAALP